MMDAQVSPNATQVHPIHIQLQGLLAHVFWIASRFGLWRVFALTVHAQIPLGTRFGFSGSVLPRGLLTFRTGLHSSILTQKSIHSLDRSGIMKHLSRIILFLSFLLNACECEASASILAAST